MCRDRPRKRLTPVGTSDGATFCHSLEFSAAVRLYFGCLLTVFDCFRLLWVYFDAAEQRYDVAFVHVQLGLRALAGVHGYHYK